MEFPTARIFLYDDLNQGERAMLQQWLPNPNGNLWEFKEINQ